MRILILGGSGFIGTAVNLFENWLIGLHFTLNQSCKTVTYLLCILTNVMQLLPKLVELLMMILTEQ